jgi:hypothetical protein
MTKTLLPAPDYSALRGESFVRNLTAGQSFGPSKSEAPVLSNPIPRLREAARARLRTASWELAKWRRIDISTRTNRDDRMLREAEQEFLAALDHSGNIEAMTIASF